MENIIVKIGFNHEGLYYKPGVGVSEEMATLYPNNVKVLSVEEVKVEDEVVEEKVEEPKKEVKQPVKVVSKKRK